MTKQLIPAQIDLADLLREAEYGRRMPWTARRKAAKGKFTRGGGEGAGNPAFLHRATGHRQFRR